MISLKEGDSMRNSIPTKFKDDIWPFTFIFIGWLIVFYLNIPLTFFHSFYDNIIRFDHR